MISLTFSFTAVDCGVLSNPANGMVDVSTTTFGSIANYTCNPGYVITGVNNRSCGSDKEWSDIPPNCERKFYNNYYVTIIIGTLFIDKRHILTVSVRPAPVSCYFLLSNPLRLSKSPHTCTKGVS